ncbi:general substrate transporter [Lipomyces kononenkoae]|uniref:General substrate transporter n=1 Tax=Lipomyces kononenkoae TaxID=34357 RepID=A0ACC3STT9_LIPKO
MVRLLNLYTISAFVALGGALFGFEIASMSGIAGTYQYKQFFNSPIGIRQGIITGAMACGSFAGSLLSPFLADSLSRKLSIQIGAVLWCIGACVQSAASGAKMLIVGRAVAGLCIGLTTTIVPIYQSEIAPRKIRGRVVTLQNFALGWGLLVQYFIQYGCSFIDSTASFRLPWAIQTLPAILLFLALFWLPRSPRWLAYQDRWDEALYVLAFLRSASCDLNDPLVLAEYKEIETQILVERQNNVNSYRALVSKRLRIRLIISVVLQAFTQLSGINFLMYFIVNILDSISNSNTLVASSILYIIGLLSTIPVMIWTDQWGRRLSLLLGAVAMFFWMELAGVLFATFGEENPVPNEAFTWIVIGRPVVSGFIQASMYLFVVSYALSWGPVSWIYPPEILPQIVRAKGVSLATATNWGVNTVLGIAIPTLWRIITWRLFIIFGSFSVLAFIFVWLLVPETKQRTLEEMDEVFQHGEPLWRSFTDRGNHDRLDILAREIEMADTGYFRRDLPLLQGTS